MSISHSGSNREYRHRRVTRDELAFALDGAAPPVHPCIEAGYQAVMSPLSEAMPKPLETLRRLALAGRVYATSRLDNVHRLMDIVGMASGSSCTIGDDVAWPGVIFVGCLGRSTDGDNQWIAEMLSRGAIIVTSDLTAGLPVIGDGLRFAPRRSAERARIAAGPDITSLLDHSSAIGQLLVSFHPAVWLAPGHPPMERDQPIGTQVLATNARTGEPVVALAEIGGGQVLHSVAHWWQEDRGDTTEMGHLPLSAIPPLSDIGRAHPAASLSSFGAASVLLTALLAGLDTAFSRIAPQEWPAGVLSMAAFE